MAGNRVTKTAVFDFFWNWLDPKILKMESWVNHKVVEPDKIDIDLDKVKKGDVQKNDMFRKAIPGKDGDIYGPFLTNLTGSQILGYLQGPSSVEAFALLNKDDELWWRHRDAGTTEDFQVGAFFDMEEFFMYAHADMSLYWDCVLRTTAELADHKTHLMPALKIPDIRAFVKKWIDDAAETKLPEQDGS